ncbi:MAG: TIGR02466 family protein, partial [Roseibium sp.]
NGYNAPHTHPGAHWSGVYYVAQPESDVGDSGKIEFVAPRVDLPHWEILQTSAFRLKRRFRPVAGEIILFPSYLLHWVYPNEADADRVTVAFNATFRKQA